MNAHHNVAGLDKGRRAVGAERGLGWTGAGERPHAEASPLRLQLSTDFGSPRHWERLVRFAKANQVSRLVFWWDYGSARFAAPFLLDQYPGWQAGSERAASETVRRDMAQAAELCRKAGLEFGYCFQVLMMPDRQRAPAGFLNAHGEPDMAGEAVYRLIEEQFDELLHIAPNLTGIELWVMECASIVISELKHQSIPIAEICRRIVDTVFRMCRRHGLDMTVDLHTAGGHPGMLDGLLTAARAHPEIIVSGDNVAGDFHLNLPFNQHLWRAAVTNPVLVHFDLNGEYWGRNFYPTSALQQYALHLNEARALGAVAVNGRISTGHDTWSPHANILPSRRQEYAPVTAGEPLPANLEVCCFDTLGGFNAEFFCRRALDPAITPRAVAGEFLRREFSAELPELADVLLDVEAVAARVFWAGQGVFSAQSVLPACGLAWGFFAHGEILTTKAGAAFAYPFSAGMAAVRLPYHNGVIGPLYRAIGPAALIEEKRQAQFDAEDLLVRARQAVVKLGADDQQFILRQFDDFAFLARAAHVVLEAEIHYFHLCTGKANPGFPDTERLNDLLPLMMELADRWGKRQPHDEYHIGRRLREWHKEVIVSLDEKGKLRRRVR